MSLSNLYLGHDGEVLSRAGRRRSENLARPLLHYDWSRSARYDCRRGSMSVKVQTKRVRGYPDWLLYNARYIRMKQCSEDGDRDQNIFNLD